MMNDARLEGGSHLLRFPSCHEKRSTRLSLSATRGHRTETVHLSTVHYSVYVNAKQQKEEERRRRGG